MSEHAIQHALSEWWNIRHKSYGLPNAAFFAIPNGGARNAVTGAMLKREGVKKGIPDIFLACPNKDYSGLFIEMKFGAGKQTKEQIEFMEYAKIHYQCEVCYDWQKAADIIDAYLKNR